MVTVFLVIAVVYFLSPLIWLVISATKSTPDLFSTFGLWFAPNFNLFTNLRDLFTYNNGIYLRWVGNTLLYAGVSAVVSTLFSAMAGYSLAKYRFPGRDAFFNIVLGAILVPGTALVLPLYLLLSGVHLTNTAWAVLLPGFVSPFGVYLCRIYAASSVPDELLEAARVDGSGEFRTFFTIVARLMAPALVTVFLFAFVGMWNNFFLPLVVLSDQNTFPLTVGLQTWNVDTSGGQQRLVISLIVTGSLVSVLPIMAAFLTLQRYWTGGLALGGVKG